MTVYELAIFPLSSVWVLLFILGCSAAAHGWAFTQTVAYARVLGRSPIWWLLTLGLLGSAIALYLQCTVIFTDRIPPLRVMDFIAYASQLFIVFSVIWYLKTRRLTVELNPYRRRANDRPDHA